MKKEISIGTITRTILLALALINQVLVVFGKCPLPIEDDTLASFLSLGFTIITAVIAWWKNNSFTKEAIRADSIMKELKGK